MNRTIFVGVILTCLGTGCAFETAAPQDDVAQGVETTRAPMTPTSGAAPASTVGPRAPVQPQSTEGARIEQSDTSPNSKPPPRIEDPDNADPMPWPWYQSGPRVAL
jgi:hypothetical protein